VVDWLIAGLGIFVIFVAPFTWIIVALAVEPVQRLVGRLVHSLRPFMIVEFLYLLPALAYIYFDYLIFQTFPSYILNTVISPISGVFVTVEGFLIAVAWQVRIRWMRGLLAVGLGVPALLLSVAVFAVSTLQYLQGNSMGKAITSSTFTTTYFQVDVVLFLAFVELYALAVLFPAIPRKDPTETEP
jgi:hypothetical protein